MTQSAMTGSEAMWGKRGDMIVRGQLPFNAEPPASVLASSEITAVDAFYARNHGPFPDIASHQWRLTVDGVVDKPLTVTYHQLTTDFCRNSSGLKLGVSIVVFRSMPHFVLVSATRVANSASCSAWRLRISRDCALAAADALASNAVVARNVKVFMSVSCGLNEGWLLI